MPYSMMLDAGHGGRDPGAVYEGRQEKDDNLALTLAIGEILQENGVDVEYTRTTDIYQTPFEKATLANQAGVDFFLSIHRNSYPTDNVVSGVESLVYNLSGLKYEMAQSINAQLETIGFVNLGVKARPNLVVLKRTQMPAVLVEVGFINSNTDNDLVDENFDAITQAIARGVLDPLMEAGLIPYVGSTEEDSTDEGGAGDSDNLGANGGESDSDNASEEGANGSDNASGEGENGSEEDDSDNVDAEEDENEPGPVYHVQVGAFRNKRYAVRLLRELQEQEYPAFIDDSGEYLRVRVGKYRKLKAAVDMERRLKMAGYSTIIVSG